MKDHAKCPYCKASLKQYWQPLTPVLVYGLAKLRARVSIKGLNEVHLQNEIDLTKNEYNNFQKLRFHGLARKVLQSDGTHKSGFWSITDKGNRFLNGTMKMPNKVKTFRNEIIEYSEEYVDIKDIIGDENYSQKIETIEFDIFTLDQTSFL